MDKLKQKAKELLESDKVQVVIGYEEGSAGKVRPVFITDSNEIDKLIFNDRCVQNLAVYLLKPEVKKVGKVAVVAPLSTLKSIIILSSENQLKEGSIEVLAVNRQGEFLEFSGFKEIEKYINENPVEYRPEEKALLVKIEAMSMEERWEYWQSEFSKCIKCYACRSACPMCYCNRCLVDCNQPQWLPTASHKLGNLEWHINRAMHLAGRCSNCGECAAACPLDIPLNLLTLKLTEEINKNFGFKAGFSLTENNALATYKSDDKETFIK